jgi:hypothetical protein
MGNFGDPTEGALVVLAGKAGSINPVAHPVCLGWQNSLFLGAEAHERGGGSVEGQ